MLFFYYFFIRIFILFTFTETCSLALFRIMQCVMLNYGEF